MPLRPDERATDGLVIERNTRTGTKVFQNENLHLTVGDSVRPSGEYLNYLAEMYVEMGLVPDEETAKSVLDTD